MTPGGVHSGAGGRTGRGRPVGKVALGGYGLGGLVWVWLGLVWARYFAHSLSSAAAAAAPADAPWAHAGATPRAGGVPGAAVGAALRLAGAAVSAPCAPEAPSRGAAAGLAAWAAGAVSSAAPNGGDLLCSQEGVYPVPRHGRREGGGRVRPLPRTGDPRDPLEVPAGRNDEEEQGAAWALLPEDLPPVLGTPGP